MLLSETSDVLMRPSCGLGKAHGSGASERPADGVGQRDAMPYGDVQWFHTCSRAEDSTNHLPIQPKLCARPASLPRCAVGTAEAGLGRADSG